MTKRGADDPPVSLPMDFSEELQRFAQSEAVEVDESAGVSRFERQINALLTQFEEARHLTEDGAELWYARDLMPVLEYKNWQNFRKALERAWNSCRAGGVDPAGHFQKADGSGPWVPDEVFTGVSKNPRGGRPSEDVILSRRAAYLVAENGDPSKLTIAVAQRYFTEQTRRQEIADESLEALTEDQRRVMIRDEVSEQNKGLSSAANAAGVTTPKDFGIFHGAGYNGMYGGLNVDGIKRAKNIPAKDQILDRMGSAELAANLFRLTQTEERLRKRDITTKAAANRTHADIGRKVRQTMIEISGTPPEKLPAADHIKHARKRIEAAEAPQLPAPSSNAKKKD